MCGHYGGMMGGSWIWAIVAGIILLLLVGGAVGAAIWYSNRGRLAAPGAGESPLDILKKRYARGEIGSEDYERMKQELL